VITDHQLPSGGIQNKNTKLKIKTILSLSIELIAAGRKSAGNTFDNIITIVPYTR